MKKYLKYVLAVAILVVACATFALADGPVATVNGQPYDSLSSALSSAQSGDRVDLVRSVTSGSVTVPSGVLFQIPQGVTLTFSGSSNLTNDGTLVSFGDIVRHEVTGSTGTIAARSGSKTDIYGNLYSSEQGGSALFAYSGSEVNIYGGDFYGYRYAVFASSENPPEVNVYGGSFSSVQNAPLAPNVQFPLGLQSQAVLVDGVYHQTGNVFLGTISNIVTSSLNWISLFCALIVANKLLLIFILFFMGFAGIGLIKRIVR